ncbi:hypothetical protein FB567DRAFT_438099 [Paraphoma chrysanthemicola]|uniref:Uncharacterized protein n=1 Tax=Paraphoma chrysanthemicola TaxID=798071 RepID=A0A8K0R8K5_9PLEO|nr:hypothetical protein FB567DRAFT_438099 [Paraphoma chrysanthemicola]
MAEQLAKKFFTAIEHLGEETEVVTTVAHGDAIRPSIDQSVSDPTPTTRDSVSDEAGTDASSSDESRDVVDDTILRTCSRPIHLRLPENRQSYSTADESPSQSRSSSPGPTPSSSATSPSIYTADSYTDFIDSRRRLSVMSRLRSSIKTASTSNLLDKRPSIEPSDFRTPPEQPEKRFVDSIGVVCPGVCDRPQCAHPLAHFISTFRICQPVEYTTAFADHGLTYTDYSRLLSSLKNFLEDHAVEVRPKSSQEVRPSTLDSTQYMHGFHESVAARQVYKGGSFLDTTEQLGKSKRQANALNQLLDDITSHLRDRGLPVMICVSSFSLFAPHRISEAHIQILHAPFSVHNRSGAVTPDEPRSGQRLSFIDPFTFASEQRSVSRSGPTLEERSQSDTTTRTQTSKYHHQTSQNRDRSRPWPLWPNAIPSRKRQAMSENADRYGVDPYFRAWMRANINARTRSSTYAKYMIEQEDDPFINTRLDYTDGSSRGALMWDVVTHGLKAWKEQFPSIVNRAKYEHNRKLECRKTIENGSRLRILRFGFRHALYPPHTPEMEELGLSKAGYQAVISNIAEIHSKAQFSTKCPFSYFLSSLNKIRRRSAEDALMKVSEYLRELNASQRRVVWTIEKIPGVYDRGLARDRTEWEISAWNGEDPLELLIQLERWGILEKRLSLEDEE